MSERDQTMTDDYATRELESLTELWQAIDDAPDSEYDGYETPDEALMAEPLEVVRVIGEPFTILLACGGPNTRIYAHADGSGAYLEVAWGGNVARRFGDAIDRTATYFADMYE